MISPLNYFTYTPLLPGAATGTVELRSITEAVRSLVAGAPLPLDALPQAFRDVRVTGMSTRLSLPAPAMHGAQISCEIQTGQLLLCVLEPSYSCMV